ncbi:MAG: hypothetical protein M0015_05855 [Betaproteobacteria bacterium]|nr:hypothetical protein [Betaproteobacteria bacterium]
MTAILSVDPRRDWPPEVRTAIVALYGTDGAGSSGFRVAHHRRLHQPWGVFVVSTPEEGEIGRLLSYPSYGDCVDMLERFRRGCAELAFAADQGSYSERARRRRRAASASSSTVKL